MDKKILVVDDNEQILRLVERLLDGTGFLVETCNAPQRVIEWFSAHGLPDLLISDINMPTMDGRALYQRLVADHGDFPVLFISTDVSSGLVGNAARILEKPFKRTDLISAIHGCFD